MSAPSLLNGWWGAVELRRSLFCAVVIDASLQCWIHSCVDERRWTAENRVPLEASLCNLEQGISVNTDAAERQSSLLRVGFVDMRNCANIIDMTASCVAEAALVLSQADFVLVAAGAGFSDSAQS